MHTSQAHDSTDTAQRSGALQIRLHPEGDLCVLYTIPYTILILREREKWDRRGGNEEERGEARWEKGEVKEERE